MNNIYLCGFMGCGKSTIGVRLAQLLGRRFLDLDNFIEKKTKMSIAEIFDEYGEIGFRQIENSVLEEVCLMKNAVVAVGGGTFAYEQNIVISKNSGKIIYLFAQFETCYKRIKSDKRRPLAAKSTKQELLDIYNRRHTLYKIAASYTFDVVHSPELCARHIVKLINNK